MKFSSLAVLACAASTASAFNPNFFKKHLFKQHGAAYPVLFASTSPSSSDINPNNLSLVKELTHQFYGLRHGQSLANVAKIISSDPSISTVEHGLSDVGKEQVRSSAIQFCRDFNREQDNRCDSRGEKDVRKMFMGVAIYTSDFRRARETAGIFTSVLTDAGIPLYSPNGAVEDVRLRERYFGSWNGKSDDHYQDVWNFDCENPNHTEFGVETVNSVVARASEMVIDVDNALSRDGGGDGKVWKIIFVAHGDVLQIAQTAFQKVDAKLHRSLDHLETASIREFSLHKSTRCDK